MQAAQPVDCISPSRLQSHVFQKRRCTHTFMLPESYGLGVASPSNVSAEQLDMASVTVCFEWLTLTEIVERLARVGVRDAVETSEFEAFLTHWRNMVLFLCGGESGGRHPNDIEPADFLGSDWWPDDDDELDRTLRGRLPVVHKSLAHLSWFRVLALEPLAWSGVFLAHEISYAMALFIEEIRARDGRCLQQFETGQARVKACLPAWDGRTPQTAVTLAPARKTPLPPRPT